ncbi:hypothetical protein BLA29_014515 [Euroglyphus maynei]|uniref:Uncharacterized protein n=1 Tax=Euroglyphus maynei TaxID=6958 RepID=A0A1Y3AXD2_EURMA|nr:hypothetical protein BLA29_014515 [Euroglyphus maynei]
MLEVIFENKEPAVNVFKLCTSLIDLCSDHGSGSHFEIKEREVRKTVDLPSTEN